MAAARQLEFFLLQYVPDAVKGEFVNIGMVMVEPHPDGAGFADVRFTRDWRRLRCLDPDADVEVLEALERDIRLQLARTSDRKQLINKLQDSYSNVIQLSPVKGCVTEEPKQEFELLGRLYLQGPKRVRTRPASGRETILERMELCWEQAGVKDLIMHDVPVSPYTKPGDPMTFDFGYRFGSTIKLFHAVSLRKNADAALMLAYRYPAIASAMTGLTRTQPSLTGIIEEELDREDTRLKFALDAMQESRIQIATPTEMPAIAETARRELLA